MPSLLDEARFTLTRSLGRVLPPAVMCALLWPWAALRAVPAAVLRPHNNPPAEIPPSRRRSGFKASVDARISNRLNTTALLWSDEFAGARWRDRIDASALGALRSLAADRPVVIVTLHFGAFVALPAVFRVHGLPTASLISAEYWPVDESRRRRSALTARHGLPAYLRAGDARGALRYLQPGRCLLVAPDHAFGERVSVPFRGGSMMVATPPLRLAALAGAAVVPALVSSERNWRFTVHIGKPVPDALIQAGDLEAAARHIVAELLPIAAQQPAHAYSQLVRAFEMLVPA